MRISDWSSDVCSSDLTAWLSLHRYKLGSRMSWVGLDNYGWLFTNPGFYNSLFKTTTIGILSTVPQLLLALGLAHLLNRSEERRGGKECGRTCRSRWSPCH